MKDTDATLGNLRGRVREYEKVAIHIRRFAQTPLLAQLDPYDLAAKLGMKLVHIEELSGITNQVAQTLLVHKASKWSGASSGVLPDGSIIIVLNETESSQRRAVTLMEEICHVLLGHQRNRLSSDLVGARDHNPKNETEAYAVGAAALVPYIGLEHFFSQGLRSAEIAQHFGVSQALVEYRANLVLPKLSGKF